MSENFEPVKDVWKKTRVNWILWLNIPWSKNTIRHHTGLVTSTHLRNRSKIPGCKNFSLFSKLQSIRSKMTWKEVIWPLIIKFGLKWSYSIWNNLVWPLRILYDIRLLIISHKLLWPWMTQFYHKWPFLTFNYLFWPKMIVIKMKRFDRFNRDLL